jgi:hypothetical protein
MLRRKPVPSELPGQYLAPGMKFDRASGQYHDLASATSRVPFGLFDWLAIVIAIASAAGLYLYTGSVFAVAVAPLMFVIVSPVARQRFRFMVQAGMHIPTRCFSATEDVYFEKHIVRKIAVPVRSKVVFSATLIEGHAVDVDFYTPLQLQLFEARRLSVSYALGVTLTAAPQETLGAAQRTGRLGKTEHFATNSLSKAEVRPLFSNLSVGPSLIFLCLFLLRAAAGGPLAHRPRRGAAGHVLLRAQDPQHRGGRAVARQVGAAIHSAVRRKTKTDTLDIFICKRKYQKKQPGFGCYAWAECAVAAIFLSMSLVMPSRS